MKYILINNITNIIENFWDVPDNFDITQVNEPNIIIHKYSFEYLPDMSSAGLLTMTVVDNIATEITYVAKPKSIRDWVFVNDNWVDNSTLIFKFTELRIKRNNELLISDWTQSPDSPLSNGKKEEWRIWRQEMRDVVNTLIPVETCNQNFINLMQNKPQ